MSTNDRVRWDAKYAARTVPDDLRPENWLISQLAGSPPGRALDLACGLGHNAIWLAALGWEVDAVDVSPVGIELARQLAAKRQVRDVNWIVADLDEFTPDAECYDLAIVFRFLNRQRLPSLIRSTLRPGGRLVYETFLQSELTLPGGHIRNPDFTLGPGELPRLYQGLRSLDYREMDSPDGAVAQFSAEKPIS